MLAQIRVSDLSGQVIPDGEGAQVSVIFAVGEIKADLTQLEAEALVGYLVAQGAALDSLVRWPGSGSEMAEPPRVDANGADSTNPPLRKKRPKPPRANQRWSTEEHATLMEMFREGRPATDIARALERTPRAIRSRLIMFGVIQ
jgi:hypothetical protein